MNDIITEEILMELKIADAIKKITSQSRMAVMKKDTKMMSKIADSVPQKKNIKQIEKEASMIPGFRKKYAEAIKITNRDRQFDQIIKKPAALAIGLVSTMSNEEPSKVAGSISEATKNAQKFVYIPSFAMIKLILFVVIILSIYVTKGAIILPALSILLKGGALVLALLGKIMKLAAKTIEAAMDPTSIFSKGVGPSKQAIDILKQRGIDMDDLMMMDIAP